MRNNDVIIIGGGLSGLMAAAAAAARGRQVLILAYGAGTLVIGGGIIDVLGYDDDGKPVSSPAEGLNKVNNAHPYKKIGLQAIAEAVAFFKKIAQAEGYPYSGELDKQLWVPTSAGTIKPTCLVPKTMDSTVLEKAEKIAVVGFDYLKDFYSHLVAKNLQKIYQCKSTVQAIDVKLNFERGRDITALDVARWLDTVKGREAFVEQLKPKLETGTTIVLPPVLGTTPSYEVLHYLENELQCHFVETASLPPAVGGLRLRTMFLNHLRKLGVKVIEKAAVAGALTADGTCKAVTTQGVDRMRAYYGKYFILASGGLYGGGLYAEPGRIVEPIFNLPVRVSTEIENWSNIMLFSHEKQAFAKFGIAVNEAMSPIDGNGRILFDNVKVVGRNIGGYDFCFEKSGNGVALASGYKAAISLSDDQAALRLPLL